ncbi:MAG: DUF2062 domain-containing protein [Gammaproteobacteria bacterium]|nr:DUF2062 domain-containing protein [Gammaproteobacteria bacterium]NND54739.1 DUF2062 domain-containing protein [Gammaproteobacteria bacterium]
MPRRFFSRISKRFDPKKKSSWYLRPFSYLLNQPVYFSAGRRAVSGGMAIGVFIGLLPIPGQTPLALFAALMLRVNLPLAAISVWISNPLTFVPIFYFAYRIGAAMLNIPAETMPESPSWAWVSEEIALRWRPLLYGSILIATSLASITYLLVSTIWHVTTFQRYRARHRKKREESRLPG